MSGDFGDLIDQSANLRTLAPAAVASQVALMTVVSVSHSAATPRVPLTDLCFTGGHYPGLQCTPSEE